MMNKSQKDELSRLAQLISDENELLSRANDVVNNLINNKKDITAQLERRMKTQLKEDRHQ